MKGIDQSCWNSTTLKKNFIFNLMSCYNLFLLEDENLSVVII